MERQENRELTAILLTVKEEQDRLQAIRTQTNDALRGLGAITQMVMEYDKIMQARIEEAKIAKDEKKIAKQEDK